MEIKTLINGDTAQMNLKGRFDFDSHKAFRGAFKEALANRAVRKIELDFGAVNYIDSSALGMLLLSKQDALAAGKSLVLKRVTGLVRQILEVANFQKMFDF